MKQSVLILCTGNSARSQMAEGLLRHDAGDRFEVESAGTKPGKVRPEAIAVMQEIGIDISHQRSKPVDEFASRSFDYVLTVCDNAHESRIFLRSDSTKGAREGTMRDDVPGDGPKNIWLNQPTEKPTITLRLIQQRLRDLRTKTRKKLLGTLAGPLATGLFYAFGMSEFASVRPVLQSLFAFAFA